MNFISKSIPIYEPQLCVFMQAFEIGRGDTSQVRRILDDAAEEHANT